MKLIEESPARLVVKQSGVGSIVIGVILLIVSGVVLSQVYPSFANGIGKDQALMALVPVLLFLGGTLVLVTAKFQTITLDKGSEKILAVSKSLYKQINAEFSFSQVDRVELQEKISQSRNTSTRQTETQRQYVLSIIMKNGQFVALEPSQSMNPLSGFVGSLPGAVEGNKMAEFLKVPFVEKRAPTLTDILSATKDAFQTAVKTAQDRQETKK